MSEKSISSLIEENKTMFIIIAIGLFLIELEIFAVAAIKSGRDYRLQVLDKKGVLVHEVAGKSLSDFNRYYFEKTFGPLENYDIKLVTDEIPFPFRAWFVAAVGIPVGIILLFGFVVKAYMTIFYGHHESKGSESDTKKTGEETRLEELVESISRFNIFTIGFFIMLIILSYWIIPEMIVYLGKLGEETIQKYKWFFLAVIVIVVVVFIWVIYLRYLLARKTIESQVEIDKFRLQLEFKQYKDLPPQLEYHSDDRKERKLVGWDKGNMTETDEGGKGKSKKK